MSSAAQPKIDVVLFWRQLGAKFAELLRSGAHAELVITVRDGQPTLVRVHQNYLPTDVVK